MNNETPQRSNYDVVVVGARCSGAATAMLLARQGLSVLLVDRDRQGADTLSTLALMRAGVLQLHRWGLLDRVKEAGTPPIESTTFVYGDERITLPIKPKDGVDALYSPRRTVLDVILSTAASEAGAEVVYGPRLVDVQRNGEGRVTGVVIEDREQQTHSIDCSLVVGADGLRSTVAKLVDAKINVQGKNTGGVVYAFWPGLENQGNRWCYGTGTATGAIPTNNGDTCIFTAVSSDRFHREIRQDMQAGFRTIVRECSPELNEELGSLSSPIQYRGFPGHPGILRQSHGPGWALVGDAGYFKDPITAHGITDALRDAEMLARAVDRGTDQALEEYQRERDALSRELFDITDEIASYTCTMDRLKTLHLDLSKEMNREVEVLLALDA